MEKAYFVIFWFDEGRYYGNIARCQMFQALINLSCDVLL